MFCFDEGRCNEKTSLLVDYRRSGLSCPLTAYSRSSLFVGVRLGVPLLYVVVLTAVPCGVAKGSGDEMSQYVKHKFTDRKVRNSNTTSASRFPLSRFGQLDSISALVLPSGSMAVRRRKGAIAERMVEKMPEHYLK
ncbi:hypothetical protein CSKR_100761 [Clonorchis sinensis]|uniref:Uncharacterized protein n=1 Tax=Clonorchis sinensis TaxID=79923 RepID=A0A3R7FAV4_CLOSI|nr:hypothetical protein CSKR_100761 [Clonorchis sinensis]